MNEKAHTNLQEENPLKEEILEQITIIKTTIDILVSSHDSAIQKLKLELSRIQELFLD